MMWTTELAHTKLTSKLQCQLWLPFVVGGHPPFISNSWTPFEVRSMPILSLSFQVGYPTHIWVPTPAQHLRLGNTPILQPHSWLPFENVPRHQFPGCLTRWEFTKNLALHPHLHPPWRLHISITHKVNLLDYLAPHCSAFLFFLVPALSSSLLPLPKNKTALVYTVWPNLLREVAVLHSLVACLPFSFYADFNQTPHTSLPATFSLLLTPSMYLPLLYFLSSSLILTTNPIVVSFSF